MEPTIIVIAVDGRVDRADIPMLRDRYRALLRGAGRDPIVCDVGGLRLPDAAAVDLLARLQLEARRLGLRVLLRGASPDLVELLAVMGLFAALPVSAPLRVEPRGQPEEREERSRVEEERDPGDLPR